jgi:uncharacterized membrane protein
MEVLEIEEAPSKQRDPRTAANSSTWKTCVGYVLLAGIVGLEFLRAADQTLKDRAFGLALDTINYSLAGFARNRTSED